MTVTIKDIARLVQTTDATVSRALNNNPRISEDTKRRVRAAALKLGYRPNYMGRSLRSGKTHIIGLLLPDLSNPFYADIARQIEKELAPADLQVTIMESWTGIRSERKALEAMYEKRCDGIITSITLLDPVKNLLKEFWDKKFPCVVIGLPPDTGVEYIDGLFTPITQGMEMAVAHLSSLGHRNIVLAASFGGSPEHLSKSIGFEAALTKCGLDYDPDVNIYCRYNANQLRDGLEMGDHIMQDRPDTTAIIVLDNYVAIGVQQGLERSGVKIPQDVSLIGTSDSWLAKNWSVPLTTLVIDQAQYGKLSASLLLKRMKDKNWFEPYQKHIDASLAVRESTGPVRSLA